MLAANVNLQVWLDTVPGTHPAVIIPYVRSPQDSIVQYRLTVVRRGPGGSSAIGQSGEVQAAADHATALSRFSLNVGAQDECRIEITIIAGDHATGSHGTYRFDCPRG